MSKRKRTVQRQDSTRETAPQTAPQQTVRVEPVRGYRCVVVIERDDGVYYGVPDDDAPKRYRALSERDWQAFQRVLDDLASFVAIDRELAVVSRVRDFSAGVCVIDLEDATEGETT